jgi:hypothetical protein
MIVITDRGCTPRLAPARWNVQPPWKPTSPRSEGASSMSKPAASIAALIRRSLSSEMGRSLPKPVRWLPR